MSQSRPQRGEIWPVYISGQPDDPHQPRPALVISENVRNRRSDDIVVIPTFSAGYPGPTRVPILAGVGGIHRDSILFCEEITTLDIDFLTSGPFGPPVPDYLLGRVLRAVRRALGEAVPEPYSGERN